MHACLCLYAIIIFSSSINYTCKNVISKLKIKTDIFSTSYQILVECMRMMEMWWWWWWKLMTFKLHLKKMGKKMRNMSDLHFFTIWQNTSWRVNEYARICDTLMWQEAMHFYVCVFVYINIYSINGGGGRKHRFARGGWSPEKVGDSVFAVRSSWPILD